MTDLTGPPQSGDLVQCEVTGKMVPKDEVVEFQGRKVCAEGKEKLLDMLKAGDKLPGELERATDLRRFGCIVLDNFLLWIISKVIFSIGKTSTMFMTPSAWLTQGILTAIIIVIGVSYFALFHGTRGQTIGKMAGKIKVVNADGSPISVKTAFLRAIYYIGIWMLLAIGMLLLGFKVKFGFEIFSLVYTIAIVYAIINGIFALTDRSQQKTIHDRLAGTRVIMAD